MALDGGGRRDPARRRHPTVDLADARADARILSGASPRGRARIGLHVRPLCGVVPSLPRAGGRAAAPYRRGGGGDLHVGSRRRARSRLTVVARLPGAASIGLRPVSVRTSRTGGPTGGGAPRRGAGSRLRASSRAAGARCPRRRRRGASSRRVRRGATAGRGRSSRAGPSPCRRGRTAPSRHGAPDPGPVADAHEGGGRRCDGSAVDARCADAPSPVRGGCSSRAARRHLRLPGGDAVGRARTRPRRHDLSPFRAAEAAAERALCRRRGRRAPARCMSGGPGGRGRRDVRPAGGTVLLRRRSRVVHPRTHVVGLLVRRTPGACRPRAGSRSTWLAAYVWRLNQMPPGPVEKLTPSPHTATVLPVLVMSTAP